MQDVDEALALIAPLVEDLERFAPECLKVRSKAGATLPLRFNRAQRYVHERLEEQRKRTGKVRAILLKARQQGFSTYVAARFYQRTSQNEGLQAFILAHEQEATDNLFAMVDRFHKHNPLRPSTGAANAKELVFDRLDSAYAIGTAGTKATGRSKTVQLFHGSEVAYWKNAADHFSGVVQTVPDMEGTEIILESTANGTGGEFHSRWQQAEAGVGDYIAIFVPWFWTEEYRRTPLPGFTLDADEAEYAELHGLDLEQMAWRRAKMEELKDPIRFMREYPATVVEAFQASGHDSFIPTALVMAARKNKSVTPRGPLVCGGDPARFGDDRFSVAWRQGRKVLKVESRTKLDTVQGANWIREIIDRDKPKRFFVDVGGIGAGVIDILHSWGAPYDKIVVAVNFGSAPFQPNPTDKEGKPMAGPKNRRAEMWSNSKDWLSDPAGVDIPDTEELHADACAPGYGYDLNQRLQLESKDAMKARGVRSPDEWDAVALTFAEPVADNEAHGKKDLKIPSFGAV